MLNREQIESNARFWQHTANIAGDTSLPNTHSDKPLRRLYFGDNLDIMGEAIPDAFVDLVYLDPPFNSDEDYNVFFETADLDPDEAQWTAFKDTWIWDEAADEALDFIVHKGTDPLGKLLQALKDSLGKSPMMAYLVNMGARLTEIYRVMKPTGSRPHEAIRGRGGLR